MDKWTASKAVRTRCFLSLQDFLCCLHHRRGGWKCFALFSSCVDYQIVAPLSKLSFRPSTIPGLLSLCLLSQSSPLLLCESYTRESDSQRTSPYVSFPSLSLFHYSCIEFPFSRRRRASLLRKYPRGHASAFFINVYSCRCLPQVTFKHNARFLLILIDLSFLSAAGRSSLGASS